MKIRWSPHKKEKKNTNTNSVRAVVNKAVHKGQLTLQKENNRQKTKYGTPKFDRGINENPLNAVLITKDACNPRWKPCSSRIPKEHYIPAAKRAVGTRVENKRVQKERGVKMQNASANARHQRGKMYIFFFFFEKLLE